MPSGNPPFPTLIKGGKNRFLPLTKGNGGICFGIREAATCQLLSDPVSGAMFLDEFDEIPMQTVILRQFRMK
jgi:hypothetical protein